MKIAADIEGDAMCSPMSGEDEVSEMIKLDDPALQKELEEYRQAIYSNFSNGLARGYKALWS